MTHEILPEAQEEFDNAVAYLNDQRNGLGGEFRYLILYTLRSEHVIIVAIMHEARRPGYWKRRLS